jgi:alkylation response protein AidB-like acyl-CoA dehydrogenase
LEELRAAGCFRVVMPRSHNGLGADLPTALRVFEALARADGSVAWTVMIGGGSWIDFAGLPRHTFDELFLDHHDVIVAGAINPTGAIAPNDDGTYRVSGRWAFASGCEHADWLFGNCVEGVVDGVPKLRIAVLRPSEVVIEDTWNVSGLRGTGSHHFRCEGVDVPADRTFDPLAEDPCIDYPAVRVPPPALYSLAIASVAAGIARGALDDILGIATTKVPLLAPAPLATNAGFQRDLAIAETDLRAAVTLLYETAESVWAAAVASEASTMREEAKVRAAAVWITDRASDVVEFAHRSGGGSAIYVDCPLQRRMRDMHALTQHFLVKRDTMTTAGAIFAGQDVDVMFF